LALFCRLPFEEHAVEDGEGLRDKELYDLERKD
jgi:hypothetical protein